MAKHQFAKIEFESCGMPAERYFSPSGVGSRVAESGLERNGEVEVRGFGRVARKRTLRCGRATIWRVGLVWGG
jgi:hypothetical protein